MNSICCWSKIERHRKNTVEQLKWFIPDLMGEQIAVKQGLDVQKQIKKKKKKISLQKIFIYSAKTFL